MKGAGSGCGYRRDPHGERTVLHLTMIQKRYEGNTIKLFNPSC